MRMQALAVGLFMLSGSAGCSQAAPKEPEEKPELSAELKSLVLDSAPSDLPSPMLLDFGGKAELIGYVLEPARLAAPGSKLSLKLFWRSTSKLGQGYQVYTELVTPGGKRFKVDGSGPVRQGALTPANWEPGKIYVDQLDVTVPEELEAPRFAIVVGLKTAPLAPEPEAEPNAKDEAEKDEKADAKEQPSPGTFGEVHLAVLSGLSDAKHGGIVATLETGVVPGTKRARTGKDDKRPASAIKRPVGAPLGKLPMPLKPRDPAARPAPPAPAAQPAK